MSPRTKTMRFVNHKSRNLPRCQKFVYRLVSQRLRRNIEDCCHARIHTLNRLLTFERAEKSVDGDGFGDAAFFEIVNLVFHQRLQRRNHHSKSAFRLSGDERGKLESETFAAAGRENCKQTFVGDGCIYGVFLQRFALVFAETVESKDFFQVDFGVQKLFAIFAIMARRIPKKSHNILYHRILMMNPMWN